MIDYLKVYHYASIATENGVFMALVFFVSPALLYHDTNISCWIVFICIKCYFLRPFLARTGSAFFFLFLFLDNSFLIDVYLVSVFVFQGVWLSVCLPAFLPIYLSDYRPTHALKMILKKIMSVISLS